MITLTSTTTPREVCRPARRPLVALLALATACAAARAQQAPAAGMAGSAAAGAWSAQPQVQQPQAPATAAADAAAKPGPRTMAERLAVILPKQKTPWKLYATYSRIYYDHARKAQAQRVGSKRQAQYQARLVQHLMLMGDLLDQMGEQTRVRDDVRLGTSTLPPAERQIAFSQAGHEHERLLAQFVKMALVLPTEAPAARS